MPAESEPERPFAATERGVRLAVRLTPQADRTGLDGVVRGPEGRRALQMRVRAPPVEGAAKRRFVAFLNEALGLRRGDVRIVSGEMSRLKTVELLGDGPRLVTELGMWIVGALTA